MLGDVNKLFVFKIFLTMPKNVLPLHLKQTFPPIIWIFTKGEGDGNDGIESRLPFKICLWHVISLFMTSIEYLFVCFLIGPAENTYSILIISHDQIDYIIHYYYWWHANHFGHDSMNHEWIFIPFPCNLLHCFEVCTTLGGVKSLVSRYSEGYSFWSIWEP